MDNYATWCKLLELFRPEFPRLRNKDIRLESKVLSSANSIDDSVMLKWHIIGQETAENELEVVCLYSCIHNRPQQTMMMMAPRDE